MSENVIKAICDNLRARLLDIEDAARRIKDLPEVKQAHNPGEAIAQSMLAVRHIEDARMRIGKVLQYVRDGVSVFDNPGVAAAVEKRWEEVEQARHAEDRAVEVIK